MTSAYCENTSNAKLIVLGCDPTSKSIGNHCFEKVFGLGSNDKEYLIQKNKNREALFNELYIYEGKYVGYFKNIYINLKEIDPNHDLSDIYIQNLCRNYNKDETGKLTGSRKEAWVEMCTIWGNELYKELKEENIPNQIPVLLTAYDLIKPLLKERSKYFDYTAEQLYREKQYIPAEDNILERALIPFFRGPSYDLNGDALVNNINRLRNKEVRNYLFSKIPEYKVRNKKYKDSIVEFIKGLGK